MKFSKSIGLIFFIFSLLISCKDSSKKSASEQGPKDPACASKTSSQCAAAADCTTSGTECIASGAFCSQFADQTACDKMNSCLWDSTSLSCVVPTLASQTPTPTPTSCSSILDQPACNANYSCQWNPSNFSCTDKTSATTACALLDQSGCQARTTDCQWNGTSCSDLTSTNCYMNTQAQCTSSLCKWSGTQCIPASTNTSTDPAGCASKTVLMCFLAPTCTWGLPFGPCNIK